MTTVPKRELYDPAYDSMPTVGDYLARESGTPGLAFERGEAYEETKSISKDCFISKEWFDLEAEHVWKKVWQFACRENEIPSVGDYYEYEIVGQSVIIVRETDSSIRAFHNVCIHRGTRLVEGCGTAQRFVCSFHGWQYGLDGKVDFLPARWDFPQLEGNDLRLREVRAETWNGMVFINMDNEAESLSDYLGPTIQRHFSEFDMAERWQGARVARVMHCNWKVLLAAFMEVYHINRTHPQLSAYVGDVNAQYDAWGNTGRMINPMAVPSPLLRDPPDEQGIVDSILGDNIADLFEVNEQKVASVSEGATAREVIAEFMRRTHGARFKRDYSSSSISEMIDAYQYYVFPNVQPWAGSMFPELYVTRPHPSDPEKSVFEVRLLFPVPPGEARPKDVQLHMLEPDEPWANAKELGELGPVIDQDVNNLKKIQLGLHSDGITDVVLSKYQEGNIRRMHRKIEHLIAAGAR